MLSLGRDLAPIQDSIQGGLDHDASRRDCSVCGASPDMKTIEVLGRSRHITVVCHHEIERYEARREIEERQVRQAALRHAYGAALPPNVHEGRSLSDLRTDFDGPRAGIAISRVFLETAKERLAAGDGMLFVGSPGTGKSTVSRALAGDLDDLGWYVIWAKAKALADRLWDARERVTTVRALEAADCLVIDEMIFEGENRHTVSVLFTVVDARYEAGKSTILTSNFEGGAMADHYQSVLTRGDEGEKFDRALVMVQRFMSRVQPPRFQRVPFVGPDLRHMLRRDWCTMSGGRENV
jgi:DNA replication protein DnaC